MNMPNRLDQKTRRLQAILRVTVKEFVRIDGGQWAAAFAFNAFFSLFPLMILLVTIASSFVDRDRAAEVVIAYVENDVPIRGEMQGYIIDTIAGVVKARGQASTIAPPPPGLGRPPMFHHPYLRDQPSLGYRGEQLVGAAAQKPVLLVVTAGSWHWLLWIYLSGCIVIFGACLCVAQAEGRSAPAETIRAC